MGRPTVVTLKSKRDEKFIGHNDIIIHDLEHNWIVMRRYREGVEIERRYIAQVRSHNSTLNLKVLEAACKGILATAAVLALLIGHPETALAIVYILKALIEANAR
jgi:hypothetical protein